MSSHGTIEITMRKGRIPLSMIFTVGQIFIDGARSDASWGISRHQLKSGPHKVFFSWQLLHWIGGEAAVEVDLAPGELVRIFYRAPIAVGFQPTVRVS